MQFKYRLSLVILATAALTVCRLHAQDDDDDDDEFGAMAMYSHAHQAISMNLKLTQSPKVKFGNLGNVVQPVAQIFGTTTYMDGSVTIDSPRPASAGNAAEVDNTGLYVANTSGGHYSVTYPVTNPTDNTVSTVTATYVAYSNQGVTRNWSYANASQGETMPGYIEFHTYSALTQGESVSSKRAYTGGIELLLQHNLTDPAKRVSYSLTAGVTLNGINSSRSATVNSTLYTLINDYSLHGAAAPSATLNPTVDGSGNPIYYTASSGMSPGTDGNTTESTVVISDTPDIQDAQSYTHDGALVNGTWKIRGAYFTFKVGPQISAKLTRSLGVNASLGVAGTYVGTSYSASETFNEVGVTTPISTLETNDTNKFLPGYYANLDATWTINDRSGFFAGISYDNLGEYNQSVGGRTARIDLTATAGVRGGLSIKF